MSSNELTINDNDEDILEDPIDDVYDHLEDEDKIDSHKVELISGEKDGSKWLLMDDIYILHKKDESSSKEFWECSGRRRYDCKFKCATMYDEEQIRVSFMYKEEVRAYMWTDQNRCYNSKI